MTAVLWRRLVAESLGTGLLVTVVVGSGIMATRLSGDVGLQLLANSTTTARVPAGGRTRPGAGGTAGRDGPVV